MKSLGSAALVRVLVKCTAPFLSLSCALAPSPGISATALDPAQTTGQPAPQATAEQPEPARQEGWREGLWATWNSLRGDEYALDAHGRFLEPGERPECDSEELVRHGGQALRYGSAVYVHPAFRERLLRFEQVVTEVAEEVYGRAPTRLRHAGAFSCRSTRKRSTRLSEHALGNAIDVMGFDFGAAPRKSPPLASLPKALRRPFQVRVAKHWHQGSSAEAALHSHFLRMLAARLEDREDVFRVMIGPSQRDHHDHFHFDMSPWRYVRF